MSDRFAWGAGDLTPDAEVVESALLDEGRHSAGWREEDHPRAEDGKFGHSGGSSGGGSPSPAASSGGSASHSASGGDGSPASSAGDGRRSSGSRDAADIPRGMPSVLATARVPARNGTAFTMEHHTDGGTIISDGHHSTKLDEYRTADLIRMLEQGDSDYMEIGDDLNVAKIERLSDGRVYSTLLAMLSRTGKDRYELKVADGDPSYDELQAATGVTATEGDLRKIVTAHARLAGATRVDTGNGDVDVFFTDDKKVGFRMLGDDGKPIEVKFKPRDFDKMMNAVNVVEEGFDEMEYFVKRPPELGDYEDSPAVSSVTFPTNVGKVRVEMIGEWRGNNPGDRLRIEAADGSWAVIVDGPQQKAWADAMDALEEADEEAEIYYRGISQEAARRPRKPRNGQVSLTESAPGQAEFQRTSKGRYNVLLIKAGQGSSGYYSEAVLKRDGPSIFPAGTHMYMDHPTPTEQAERPERSTLTWASVTTTDPFWDPAREGIVAEVEVFPHWRAILNEEFAKRLGLSIRASGTVEHGEIDGKPTKIVTSLDEGISVDWVTKAGAGGRVLDLIESARTEGELLEEKGNLAPPFTKKDGKVKKGEKPDDEDDTDAEDGDDEDKDDAKKKDGKGKMPAFLKAKFKAKEADLAEAATVGAYFESRIHSDFTRSADDLYGEGRLTRDERKALSSAIGAALDAFVRTVEAANPHLYQRGPWEDPMVTPAAMTGSTTMEGAPMSGSTKQDAPERGTEVTESARVSELTTALAEARRVATALTEAQVASNEQLAELKERLDASDAEKLDMANEKAARTRCEEALKTSGLNAASQRRVTESVVRDLPTDDDGALDTKALAEAITAAIDDKKAELAEALESAGVGSVRGLGESRADTSDGDIDKQLEEAFAGLGLNESAARVAVHGRN